MAWIAGVIWSWSVGAQGSMGSQLALQMKSAGNSMYAGPKISHIEEWI